MSTLSIEIPQSKIAYTIKIEKGVLNKIAQEISTVYKNKQIAIITDQTVYRLYGEKVESNLMLSGFDVKMIIVNPGEQSKSMEQLAVIYDELIQFGITRSDLIIALGGGVIGDLAGYAAASFLRGVAYIQIPTTLLAQVDSSVGGKVAIDLPQGKNLVGAFYHPTRVIIDPTVLVTLTDDSFRDGCAEVIKYGCIQDIEFFKQLSQYHHRDEMMEDITQIISQCCQLKSQLVQADEKDTSQRMLLNFGHTLGHAIEAYYHYANYTHGQAIAIGMVAINQIAENLGHSPLGSTSKIKTILQQYKLPTTLSEPSDYSHILPLINNDKKNLNNRLNAIILKDIGQAEILEVSLDFFQPLMKGV